MQKRGINSDRNGKTGNRDLNFKYNLESGEISMRQIAVKWDDKQVIYELNDSSISTSLMEQLPLTVE